MRDSKNYYIATKLQYILMSKIIKEATKILDRIDKAHASYGPPKKSMENAAVIASILCGKEITSQDVVKIQMALKLSRESNAHKEDNLIDLVAYVSILNDLQKKDETT